MLMDAKLLIEVQAPKLKFPKDTPNDLKSALKVFTHGQTGVFGNYISTSNALVYRTVSVVDGLGQDVLMIRLIQDGKVHYLGNSSRLRFCGTKVAFGQRTRSWRESPAQQTFNAMGFAMLPFDAFTEAGLKLMDTEIIHHSGAEMVQRKTGERKGKPIFQDVHYTGATLFKLGTRIFLFDIDRVEIQHGIFNPFIVELAPFAKVDTVSQAYDSLIPDEVRQAKTQGKTVLRQGEYFLIKVAELNELEADKTQDDRWNDGFKQGRLEAQGNRPHVASRFNEASGFISGVLEHWGREHKDLNLDGWFRPVPNTAVRSFTLVGDVD